jgi:hypothetical protein
MDPAVAAERYPHGTRARYVLAGCRCFPCRVATTNYETERQAERRKPRRVHYVQERREWIVRHRETGVIEFRSADRDVVYRKLRELNGQELEESLRELIGTRAVREHLRWLSGVGVGYKTVARASGVASSVVFKIHTGAIRRTRRGTADRILAVGASDARGAAIVDAAATWVLLDRLLELGYRRGWIAQQLGAQRPALQIQRDRVTATTARKVEQLYARLWREDPRLRALVDEIPVAV